MAQRRMFSKKVTDTDVFLDMPLSAQALYFHLNMHADDDGFIDNMKMIQRMIGSSEDDRKLLIAKQLIIPFENGVVVIKDWRVHNYIRKDTYNKTMHMDKLEQLDVNDSGQYEQKNEVMLTSRRRDVDETSTQVRIGKERLGEVSKYIVEQDFIFPDYLSEKSIESVKKGNTENYEFRIPIAYLNQKANRNYKFIEKSIKLVKARFNEGFTLDDFKHVIEVKTDEWINDNNMSKYLRPETLFGTKFEGYLNQKNTKKKTDWSDPNFDPFA